jgi:hypothetical protein
MTTQTTAGSRPEPRPGGSGPSAAAAPSPSANARAASVSADTPGVDWRPADFAALQECLTLLARAVRQFHTYPATSPLCVEAIAAAQKGLVALTAREHLVFRVAPAHLSVDEIPVGAGTAIEAELARRLHRAQVATVEIARTARPRDLTHFCADLSGFGDAARSTLTFVEVLTEHGVGDITVRTAHRPEVLEIGALGPPVRQLVDHERQRRQTLFTAGGPVQHLYPPDKGWVRVDPSADYESFSLVDLAVLIDSPAEVAVALMRLTGDDADVSVDRHTAFAQKFSDLATIFSAVDPRLSRLLFSKLSRAVLELDADRRATLLKRTVLPGLLDGKLDGAVLTDFPDVDLAEALCLLLDLETAAPEVLTTALDRLGLSPERRQVLAPMLEERLLRGSRAQPGAYGHDQAIERHARRLIELNGAQERSFAEYTAFDLSVTERTRAAVSGLVDAIAATDVLAAQLETVFRLVRLEPNPAVVTAFMGRLQTLFGLLDRERHWATLAQWGGRFRDLAAALRATRPDVADAVAAGLQGYCTPARVVALTDLYKADGKSRAVADAFVDGFGAATAGAFVAALDDPATSASVRPIVSLMCDHAETLAPVLVTHLPSCGAPARQAIVRVLGAAGASYGPHVIGLLKLEDEQTTREALRALAKMGGAPAAAAVATQLESGAAWSKLAAEEALFKFPPPQAIAQVRKLLASRAFIVSQPDTASRLLDRAAQSGAGSLGPVLEAIAPLRFRFWNPALVRVALKARQLMHP